MEEDFGLSDEALCELKKARDEMDNSGEFVSHEEIMARYGLSQQAARSTAHKVNSTKDK